jgi:kynurenine formamidase
LKSEIFPSFTALPRLSNGLRAAWGVFGDDDDLGSANLLTDEVVVRAAVDEIRTGRRINVSLPLTEPSPTFFGRQKLRHAIFDIGPVSQDDKVDDFYLQGSSQWDGLRHRRDPEVGFYNAVRASDAGESGDRLGADAWAAGGLIGRGVLIDVKRNANMGDYNPLSAVRIGRSDLQTALDKQCQVLRAGDILLIHTGYIDAFLAADECTRERARDLDGAVGLVPDEDMAEFLWDNGIAAVAVDNPAVEVWPRDNTVPSLHGRLIPMLGFVLGEFFDFRELSKVCAEESRYSCFFVSVPLNLPGAVGSPANAIVVL